MWEPYDGRLSRTVLREPGGEIPPGYSPTGNGGRSIDLTRDGYVISVGGNTEADPVRIATVGVNVYSPCIDAPVDILDWKADPSPPPLG